MLLLFAIISVFVALGCYGASLWSEFFLGAITRRVRGLFWTGFAFDAIGLALMFMLAGRFILNLHGVLGLLALALMGARAVWLERNYRYRQGRRIWLPYTFVSVMVWLVVFVSGFFAH